MDLQSTSLECVYEIKCTRRNILFNIFILLALLSTAVSPFLIYPTENKIGISGFDLPWYSRALSSSIPFMTAHYYNFIQLLIIIFITTNDLRRNKLTAMSALDTHPQYNADVIIGRFVGRIFMFTIVSVITFSITICYNAIYFSQVFNLSFYLFYWITLTFPALIYFLGLSVFVTQLTRGQGTSIFVLLLLGGGTTFYCTGVMHELFDPLARHIPNLFSDFTGHPNLYPYLLHRIIYLFSGLFLVILSIQAYKRIPNIPRLHRPNLVTASIPLAVIIILTSLYYSYFKRIEQTENKYRQIYLKHENALKAEVTQNDIILHETTGDSILAESKLSLVNRHTETIFPLLYLNPGLNIKEIRNNNTYLPFEREGQAILLKQALLPGDSCHITIKYAGIMDKSICYLDVPSSRRDSSAENYRGIYRFGNTPTICTNNYKLFTPECLWYPVCEPPTCFSISRKVNFTRYKLKVIHDEQHVAISQGNALNRQTGETVFLHDHDLQGISLCLGEYAKKMILVDSIYTELYYLPAHKYLLPKFQVDTPFLSEILSRVKFQRLEERAHIYVNTPTGKDIQEFDKQKHGEPNLRYPFKWLRLVETPAYFNCRTKNDEIDGEKVQAGLVFFPEKLCTQERNPLNARDIRTDLSNLQTEAVRHTLHTYFDNFVTDFLTQGSSNLKPTLRKPCCHVHSIHFPLIDDILSVMLNRDIITPRTDKMEEYSIIKYMSCHSLVEAINDSCLLPKELFAILKKKSQELRGIIYTLVPKADYENLYFEFFSTYRFANVNFQVFADDFYRRFHVDLNEVLEKWYTRKQLPVFKTKGKCYAGLSSPDGSEGDEEKKLYYVYEIFNTSDVDGVVTLSPGGYIHIPKHSCKKIVTQTIHPSLCSFWYKGKQTCFTSYYIDMPMAQNLPSIQTFLHEKETPGTTSMQTGIFDSDTLSFQANPDELIIDNLNPGCKIIESKSWIQTLFNKYRVSFPVFKKYMDKKNTSSKRHFDIGENYEGFPIRSAYYKLNGEGNSSIEWTADILTNGKYELFVHSINRSNDLFSEYEKTQYFTIYIGGDVHEVKIDVSEQNEGWVSLGKYNIEDHKIRIIQYDKQDLSISWYMKSRDFVIADAIKLCKIQ